MQNGGSSAAAAPKAGFWIRFVAYIIDSLVFGIPLGIILGLAGGFSAASTGAYGSESSGPSGVVLVIYAIAVLASIAYFVYFWSRPDGQTLGMKAVNVRVVKTDGSPVSPGSAFVRWIGYIVNSIIFGLPIGFIWAAFDKNKQGWHDKMAGTYVIKKS
jgi:uncharacterized RDD family membrane protein YckC